MNTKELTIQESQQAALQVLIRFDRICKENGLRYYLIYGTLIGAIRHRGFIPWDDDIDVMMPRPDFDRFVRFCGEHSAELLPLKLHTRANTPYYAYGIPRLSDLRYRCIPINGWPQQTDIGAFIDIYPWDNFGSSRAEAERIWSQCRALNRAYQWYLYPSNRDDSALKAVGRRAAHGLLRAVKGADYPQRIDAILREKILSSTSEADSFFGHVVWARGVAQFEKSRLMELRAVRHEFAGHLFDIPAAYDYILTTSYGDYMQLPPEEERHPTHDYCLTVRE